MKGITDEIDELFMRHGIDWNREPDEGENRHVESDLKELVRFSEEAGKLCEIRDTGRGPRYAFMAFGYRPDGFPAAFTGEIRTVVCRGLNGFVRAYLTAERALTETEEAVVRKAVTGSGFTDALFSCEPEITVNGGRVREGDVFRYTVKVVLDHKDLKEPVQEWQDAFYTVLKAAGAVSSALADLEKSGAEGFGMFDGEWEGKGGWRLIRDEGC